MKISEVAKLSGLSEKQIRDYEKAHLLVSISRSVAGYRHYNEKDLKRLHFIRHARDVGFSLQQIAQLLKLQDDPHRNSREVKALTTQHIAALNQQIEKLQGMVEKLQSWSEHCQNNHCPECSILGGLIGKPETATKSS